MPPPAATICIVTKNRRDDLRRAVRSAVAQEGAIAEVLVVDDGSSDGTAEMIRADFPGVRLEQYGESRGYIARRNEGVRLASAPILFSIDDDAEFSAPGIVAHVLREFDQERVGAVAVPFINVLQGPRVMQAAPAAEGVFVADRFIGTAHALRCELFRRLGGYWEPFVHQNEEQDYCIRMFDAGYCVRLGTSPPIHHYESLQRSWHRMDYYGRRNDVLFAWRNVPSKELPVHLAGTVFNGLRAAVSGAHHPTKMIAGTMAGLTGIARYWKDRRPVSRSTYRISRRLKKGGAISLDELRPVGDALPKLVSTSSSVP